jgi:hypothetical protein
MDIFDYTAWIARYPEFATVPQATVTAYFSEAGIYLNSRIPAGAQRVVYLNMITAHICAIYSGVGGNQPSGVVGRVSTAKQGSVNVALQYTPANNDLQAWFNQTVYGAAYWAATAGYRTLHYVPGRSRGHYLGSRPGCG